MANCPIFHNVQAQERIVRQLAGEGREFADVMPARLMVPVEWRGSGDRRGAAEASRRR